MVGPVPEFEQEPTPEGFVAGQLLIATPSLTDPNFWNFGLTMVEQMVEQAEDLAT